MINLNDLWRLFVGLMMFIVDILVVRLLSDDRNTPPLIDRLFELYHKAMYPSVYGNKK